MSAMTVIAQNNRWAVVDALGRVLAGGFKTNAAAWAWLDRQERRPLWCGSKAQFRVEPYYAVPSSGAGP